MMAPDRGASSRGRTIATARRGRLALTALGVIALAVLLSACGAPPRPPKTAVIASGADLESGNPLVTVHTLSRQLQRHALFVTLVRLDSALRAVPYYASRWQWDADRRAVTFTLVPDLRWHDGVPTSAHDVVFTIHAAQDASLGSPRAGEVAMIESVVAPSDTTVRVLFRAARTTLPTVLAELPLVPQHLLDTVPRARWREHPFSTAPVGNGPFRFVARTPGQQWRFAANPAFPASMGGPPQLAHLVVAVVDEAATKFAGLVSGALDLAGVSPTMAHLVARDPTLALMSPPVLSSTVLAFNTTRAPFDDVRVRRAISLSIDRARLVQAAAAGFGTPAWSAVPPGLPFSPPAPTVALDPRAAQAHAAQLLDAAGWRITATGGRAKDGQPLRITLLTVGSGDMAVEQLVQADLAALGVDLQLRVMEMATFLATVRASAKTFDVVLTGIPGDIAMGHLLAMFQQSQRGGALDYTGYHTASLDSALQAATQATDSESPRAWARVSQELDLAMPVAWLYHARGVQGRSRHLEHVEMDLRGELTSVAQWSRRDRP